MIALTLGLPQDEESRREADKSAVTQRLPSSTDAEDSHVGVADPDHARCGCLNLTDVVADVSRHSTAPSGESTTALSDGWP